MITANRSYRLAALGLALLATIGSPADAAEWGTITGRFVYQGEVKVEPIQPNKDIEYCLQHKPVVETITLGEDNALRNVFVYLYVERGKTVDIHPDYTAAEPEPKVLDNKGCRFEPHALTVWTAEPFEIHNSDPFGHNTNGQLLTVNTRFNDSVPNDAPLKKKFTRSETVPVMITCSMHPWMNAALLVRENPYMAVSGEDGSFEIKDIPAGEQKFVFWHEVRGFMRDLPVGGDEADRKGQVELTVPAGETLDLGDIAVAPEILGQ
jgi:hypothetical protein